MFDSTTPNGLFSFPILPAPTSSLSTAQAPPTQQQSDTNIDNEIITNNNYYLTKNQQQNSFKVLPDNIQVS